ncbi:hypothetical protein MesoLjLc_17300 [Mesorhizobium sp. L-8-10]|uniref:LysR family transcriptional regulator n=1 Tax=Mesorhizobium sp. L-8-10 TaxID=2744523 RepID=UPI0019268BAB|nr:LysR family transcriptional regulator [Mesorhizobium sp. L-8-10]BCH29800.1 hypothetical protein MesoLjLc_17300 [Mesorhizobium sp. L-8-10]
MAARFSSGAIPARLTNAGQRFLDDVLAALRQLDQSQRSAHAAGRAEAGIVRMGIIASLAGGLLRELVVTYQARAPNTPFPVRLKGLQSQNYVSLPKAPVLVLISASLIGCSACRRHA